MSFIQARKLAKFLESRIHPSVLELLKKRKLSEIMTFITEGNDPVLIVINRHGIDFSIEWPRGSTREYKNTNYKCLMKCHYGFVANAVSEYDGDFVDVYLGSNPNNEVYVVTQLKMSDEFPGVDNKPERTFDEFKYLVDLPSREEAEKMYLCHMTPEHFGGIFTMSIDDFKSMVSTMRKSYSK